jgi:hypothetical protein
MIREDALMNNVGGASKAHPDWHLIHFLLTEGRAACARWLASAQDLTNQPSSADPAPVAKRSKLRLAQAFL